MEVQCSPLSYSRVSDLTGSVNDLYCSCSFSFCVFYENNEQYCLLTKYLTHSTRIDGRLIGYLQASAHSALGAAEIAASRKEAK